MTTDNLETPYGMTLSRRQVIQGTSAIAAATTLISGSASAQAVPEGIPVEVTPGMTVGQYLLKRLLAEGVTHTFGVPGDFVYDVCDAIEDDPELQGVWCANELNASFAANSAARARNTIGVGVFTMGAELSALQALADANSEQVPVLHLTAMPSFAEQAKRERGHHQIEGMQFDRQDLFLKMTLPLTAGENAGAVIAPENAVEEIERVIALMRYHSKPGILAFPRLVAQSPIIVPPGELNTPLKNPQSDPDALDAAVREILHRIENASRPIWLPGYAIRRFDAVAEMVAAIEKSQMPFFSALQDTAVLSQSHPQFGGRYVGRWDGAADFGISDYIEGSDCIIAIGPENHSFNNAFHTVPDELVDTVNIMPRRTRIGFAVYDNVNMKDVLRELANRITPQSIDAMPPAATNLLSETLEGSAGDAITYDPLYQRLQAFLKPNDIVVNDTSLCALSYVPRMRFPEGVSLEAGMSFGMLGFGTPVALGAALAGDGRRLVMFAGEGAHQMTANELGAFYRYEAKPVMLIVNNNGYGAERATNRYPDEKYNDVAQWNYADLPAAMGCEDWFTAKVETLGELDAALATASNADAGVYIEIVVDMNEMPIGADWLFGATGSYWNLAGRTWEQWLTEGRALKL